MAAYSPTPLYKKLGLKPGFLITLYNPPSGYRELVIDVWDALIVEEAVTKRKDFIHIFIINYANIEELLCNYKLQIKDAGMIWVSWPKVSKTNKHRQIDENGIRAIALKSGLVDIKVCSFNDEWSALKLVIPVKDRKQPV